jgi:hypothetical protein
MAKVFFSYSHKDEALRDELQKHLSILRRQGSIEIWHDRGIGAGADFGHDISSHLEDADIILLLVSSDFLDSDYCYDKEMTRAIERCEQGEAIVIPVILRPCSWTGAPFGKLLATPTDGKPVTKFPSLDDGFLEVTTAIERAVRSIQPKQAISSFSPLSAPTSVVTPESPRSSNLRIKKIFTDHEQDIFLEAAYNYICNFFEGSLQELENRNPVIRTGFNKIDSQHFSAKIYQNGRLISGCRIWYGGRRSFSSGILYSNNPDSASDGAYNESISVDNDCYSLSLKPLGMPHLGMDRECRMTDEGAAEYLWSLLLRPLQQ